MIVSGNHFRPILQEYGMNPDQNMAEYAARRILTKIDKVPNVLAKAIAQGRPRIPRGSPPLTALMLPRSRSRSARARPIRTWSLHYQALPCYGGDGRPVLPAQADPDRRRSPCDRWREVTYCDWAARSWDCPAASRDSACATSVRITSPTLKRVARLFELRPRALWQIYSRRFSLPIHFRQCGHRFCGSRAMRVTMAWRTDGKLG